MTIYYPNMDLPPAYQELIDRAGLRDVEIADLLNDAHAPCTTHNEPIVAVWRGLALCRSCIRARYSQPVRNRTPRGEAML